MSPLYLMTGLAMGIFAVALVGLAWLIRSGQFDDLDTPSIRALNEDEPAAPQPERRP
jgi:cbb3-type cytochrome oxidase maturation protein